MHEAAEPPADKVEPVNGTEPPVAPGPGPASNGWDEKLLQHSSDPDALSEWADTARMHGRHLEAAAYLKRLLQVSDGADAGAETGRGKFEILGALGHSYLAASHQEATVVLGISLPYLSTTSAYGRVQTSATRARLAMSSPQTGPSPPQ